MRAPLPTVVVHPDAEVLAAAAAARLLTRLADAQAQRGTASVVLTGGGIGIALLRSVASTVASSGVSSGARDAVDWSAVDVWWGDERWLPRDDSERNERQAREALLDHLPLDPARVRAVGASDDPAATPEAAAAAYAEALAAAAPDGEVVPAFDVLLLGMGAEGHTASIFPESPAARDARTVLAVHDCPKPPPTRVSLGFVALTSAREVWMVVAGQDKAPMVAAAVSGADRVQVPAAGPQGREATLWLLDEQAASALPAELRHH